jgi:hypothetical protein
MLVTLYNLLTGSARVQLYKHNLSKMLENVLHLSQKTGLEKKGSVIYYVTMMK